MFSRATVKHLATYLESGLCLDLIHQSICHALIELHPLITIPRANVEAYLGEHLHGKLRCDSSRSNQLVEGVRERHTEPGGT